QFFHAVGIPHGDLRQSLRIARLSGRVGPQAARFVGRRFRGDPTPRTLLLQCFLLGNAARLLHLLLGADLVLALCVCLALLCLYFALLCFFASHRFLHPRMSLPLPPRAVASRLEIPPAPTIML